MNNVFAFLLGGLIVFAIAFVTRAYETASRAEYVAYSIFIAGTSIVVFVPLISPQAEHLADSIFVCAWVVFLLTLHSRV